MLAASNGKLLLVGCEWNPHHAHFGGGSLLFQLADSTVINQQDFVLRPGFAKIVRCLNRKSRWMRTGSHLTRGQAML